MNRQQVIKSLIIIPVIAIFVSLAGSQNGQTFKGLPIFAIGVGLVFLINWLAFIPAKILQTEKFFDLIGSFSFITIVLMVLYFS